LEELLHVFSMRPNVEVQVNHFSAELVSRCSFRITTVIDASRITPREEAPGYFLGQYLIELLVYKAILIPRSEVDQEIHYTRTHSYKLSMLTEYLVLVSR
jgi:hypothetical protein